VDGVMLWIRLLSALKSIMMEKIKPASSSSSSSTWDEKSEDRSPATVAA